MPAPEFSIDITLDGHAYPAARGNLGERQITTTYVPKVKSERINEVGSATLDPIEYTTFHRGSGASRNIGIAGMNAYGENVWTCDPGILMPGPEVTSVNLTGANVAPRPDGIAEADGSIFVAAGRYVFKLANGQGASPLPTQDYDLTAGYRGLALRRFGSSLILSASSDAGVPIALSERPDGGAWTFTQLGGLPVMPNGALGRVWWTTGGITSERLVAQFGPRGLRYCAASPRLDSNWTPGLGFPAIDIGGEGRITRLTHTMTHLYIAATAGLHDLDASGLAPNLVPEAEGMPMPSGGLAALAADGNLYYSAGYDLFRVVATGTQYARVETITPLVHLPNESPPAGYGTALVKSAEWLIYAMYDPKNDVSWICWGREAGEQEVGPIVWNVAPIVMRGWKVTALHVSGLATDGPRLWIFGSTLAGAVWARWAPLPFTTPYADLRANRGRRFSQTGFLVLPAEDGGDDSIPKDIEEILSESENLSGGNTIRFSARKESETAYTQLANYASGPRITVRIPQAYVSTRPQFRIDLTGTPLSPPISRRISVRWLPNPDLREVRNYMLKLGRYEQYGSGQWNFESATGQVERLVRLAVTAARVNMIDERNTALVVRVLKIDGPQEFQAPTSNDRVLVVGLTLSVFGGLPGPTFGWDSGVPYDSGRSWA